MAQGILHAASSDSLVLQQADVTAVLYCRRACKKNRRTDASQKAAILVRRAVKCDDHDRQLLDVAN
eukprot:1141761-Pelagomonas_calceolata.AAC.5